MNTLNKPNTIWNIRKIEGLMIKDNVNWQNFIFQDATIVNSKQLKEYVDNNGFWLDNDFDKILGSSSVHDAYIVAASIMKPEDYSSKIKIDQKRVYEIMGFIYFVFLFMSNNKYGIVLSEQINPASGGSGIAIGGNKKFTVWQKHTKGEFNISTPPEPYLYDIEELVNIFKRPYFSNIFNLVKSKKDDNLILAIRNFYITSNANSAATQLLGSITSLELLLKIDRKDSFDNLRKRVYVIGEMQQNSKIVSNIENLSAVIDVRNDVIHNGKFSTNNEALGSIKLFSCALIMYAHLYKKLKHRNVICRHLDLVYSVIKDDGLKMDTFNVKNEWENYYFEYDSIDWHIREITSYYGLCNPEKDDIDLIKYVEAIALYSNLSNKEMELSFNNFKDFNYYHRFPFDRYDSYIALYNENEQQINEKIESFKRWHGLA
ncbi:MAG: hypothetical protein M9949_04835 [Candidatus Kapabacteria bacterium]|nr:hypothetical protein [Candidatus Kapabacteria bacterium]